MQSTRFAFRATIFLRSFQHQAPHRASAFSTTSQPFVSSLSKPAKARPRFRRELPSLHRHVSSRRFLSFFRRSSTSSTPPPSLSQRLKKLSREYGWSALGVYLALSALDFPFCFLAVRLVGTDRIGQFEHAAVSWVKGWLPFSQENQEAIIEGIEDGVEEVGGAVKRGYDHGVEEADRVNKGEEASIWTQLALAYAIHKSFIFIRVPLTAAVTPKVVKVLRSWGWDIGKRKPKATILGSKTGVDVAKGTGINPGLPKKPRD